MLLPGGGISPMALDSESLSDVYSNTGAVQDRAAARYITAYRAAIGDGWIGMEEFAVLSSLAADFDKRFSEHGAAVSDAAELAGRVAVIVVAVVATVASEGSLGLVAEGLLEKYGILGTGIVAGAAKVVVSEAVGGAHYAAMSPEGMADFITGFADGATTILALRFTSLLGLDGELTRQRADVAHLRCERPRVRSGGEGCSHGCAEGRYRGLPHRRRRRARHHGPRRRNVEGERDGGLPRQRRRVHPRRPDGRLDRCRRGRCERRARGLRPGIAPRSGSRRARSSG